ncbi:MAG: discoidin domain-containing protein [Pirellulales bacterium]|nr:discoidin domain-containing protein [Pirellulales bacterium]
MSTILPSLFAFVAFGVSAILVHAAEPKPGNIAPMAKVTASSSRSEFPPPGVNDNRMDTQWSATREKETGEWLQFDWEAPQDICAVALYATGPWIQSLDVQIKREGAWISVGRSGSKEERMPEYVVVTCKPQHTNSLRFVFDGPGAAFHEVEIYHDPALAARIAADYVKTQVAVAGDLRGHLLGTVSRVDGSIAVRNADVTVTGKTPAGPWKETAKTGPNGDFEVPLPFAATGPIKVAVAKNDAKSEQEFDSGDVSTRLTPRTRDHRKNRVSLGGTWDFAVDPPQDFPANRQQIAWSPIKVPAHWAMEGFTAESGKAVYRKSFPAPAEWEGKRIKFRADAVYSRAQVWVNGKRIGGHEGGFTPFEFDITESVKPGAKNEVLVLVDARSMASEIDHASNYAYFELAGIWQPVEVFAVEPVNISHFGVNTDFDSSYRDAALAVETDVVNESANARAANVNMRLFDPQGKEVPVEGLAAPISLGPWERKTVSLKTTVKAPQPWNAEQPRLYKLVVELSGNAEPSAIAVEQLFGFREIEVQGRVLAINGKPVKYRGVNRLSAHPLMGRAIAPEIIRQDTELIKGANFNLIRNHIGPANPLVMDDADEFGLYVESEGPACWAERTNDLRYVTLYQGIFCEFVERDRNHPSVVDWSICNESNYPGRMFVATFHKVKSLDPSRTCSASYDNHTLDMNVYHHPISLKRIEETKNERKPVFFDEVLGVFHGWQDLALFEDIDPGMRDYWITGMPEIQRAINANENQVGANQWAWVDDTFLVPGKGIGHWHRSHPPIYYATPTYKMPQRGIVGDVIWGTVDGWRRPRPEHWLSKKLYSPVQIPEKPLAIPVPGEPIEIPLGSYNQFADLDQYVCRWELAGERGEARGHAPPLGKGLLKIAAKRAPRPDDILTLKFFDERDKMVDAYRLSFAPRAIPAFPNSGKPARIAEQTGTLDLEGTVAVRMLGPKMELSYERASGELYRALANRETILTLGPKLHVQKSKAPALEYPVGQRGKIGQAFGPEDVPGDSVWQFTGDERRTEGNQAVLRWNGKYGKDFSGGFEIRMDDAGDAEFRYEFTYNGPEMWVREIGLDFELPLDFDKLSWDRNAEYSYYPADHIGRPRGEAVAHPAVPQIVPPGDRPYALDDHPRGSNDFRGTKRNIYTAGLTNKAGQGVQVFSDGAQHVRATVGTHEIHFKVLDFYGGMSWTYHGGYHYGPGRLLKTGEVLKGTVRMKFLGDIAGGSK